MIKGRGKADFRVRREMVGLSQSDVAEALGVAAVSVKRWEREGFPDPPEDAWDLVEAFERRMADAVETACSIVDDVSEEAGTRPGSVELTIFRSQEDFDRWGRGDGPHGFVNACAFEAARVLSDEGLDVRFVYPEDSSVPTARLGADAGGAEDRGRRAGGGSWGDRGGDRGVTRLDVRRMCKRLRFTW